MSLETTVRMDNQRSSNLTNHLYHLPLSSKQPWVTLAIVSNAPSSRSLPIFYQEDTIHGEVHLNLEKADHIEGIVVTVWGRVTVVNDSHRFFWKTSETLWNVSMGDPRNPSPHFQGKAWSPKLVGAYSWSFGIKLPATVTVPLKGGIVSPAYSLPQSHTEKSHIIYHIEVRVARGVLRADSKVETNVIYFPRTKANVASELRRMAYSERSPLLGPDVDPEGWSIPRKIILKGSIPGYPANQVVWELAIAMPLEHARGTTIPLSLKLESTDILILELLANPSVPVVGLVGFQRWDCDSSQKLPPKDRNSKGGPSAMEFRAVTHVAGATWWVPDDADAFGLTTRRMEGEILIPKNAIPSFEFWKVGVEYQVHMLPPAVNGFVVEEGFEDTQIATVKIVTDKAIGPSPRSYARKDAEEHAKKVEKQVMDFFVPPPPLVKGASKDGSGAREDILNGVMPFTFND